MKDNELNSLGLEEKARVIVNEGVYISRVEYHKIEISLYRINGEPVEIWFEPENEKVTQINFLKEKKFNPFLKHMNTCNLN